MWFLASWFLCTFCFSLVFLLLWKDRWRRTGRKPGQRHHLSDAEQRLQSTLRLDAAPPPAFHGAARRRWPKKSAAVPRKTSTSALKVGRPPGLDVQLCALRSAAGDQRSTTERVTSSPELPRQPWHCHADKSRSSARSPAEHRRRRAQSSETWPEPPAEPGEPKVCTNPRILKKDENKPQHVVQLLQSDDGKRHCRVVLIKSAPTIKTRKK